MSPHYGTGVNALQLFLLSLLSIAEAIELSNPPFTSPGSVLNISWDYSSDDPPNFELQVGFCENSNGPLLFDQPAVGTHSAFHRAFIPGTLPSGLKLPKTKDLITSSPVELIPAGSTFTSLETKSSTSTQDITVTNVPTSHASIIPSLSPTRSSAVLSLRPTIFPPSLTTHFFSVSTTSTVSKATLSITSEFTTISISISTATPTQSSATPEGAKRPIGPLVGEVLGGVFAFFVLLSVFIAWWIWRRRQVRRANPFVSDETYEQRMSKRVCSTASPWQSEEFKNERETVGIWQALQSQQLIVPGVNYQMHEESGDSLGSPRTATATWTGIGTEIGTATVEEEMTMLRERVLALEDQFHSVIVVPPEYSQ
ncbi:hypothetical protein C0995_013356 [Termitomyces sp. Mi166|nr:hypothetical protein C0995_013356 [Termitomyces sp. Mi166\